MCVMYMKHVCWQWSSQQSCTQNPGSNAVTLRTKPSHLLILKGTMTGFPVGGNITLKVSSSHTDQAVLMGMTSLSVSMRPIVFMCTCGVCVVKMLFPGQGPYQPSPCVWPSLTLKSLRAPSNSISRASVFCSSS